MRKQQEKRTKNESRFIAYSPPPPFAAKMKIKRNPNNKGTERKKKEKNLSGKARHVESVVNSSMSRYGDVAYLFSLKKKYRAQERKKKSKRERRKKIQCEQYRIRYRLSRIHH
jgi:hypothetical protein